MRIAYLLLLGLIGISPALLFVDGPMIHALLVAYAAVALGLVGALIRPGEAGYLASVIRPIALIAAILAAWLLAQLLPLPSKNLAHPIWAGAETALGTTIASGITIDPGATLVAICRYLSMIAILFVATAVTIDRLRAERVLFWLVGATTVGAAVQIIQGFVSFEFLGESTEARISESTSALSALGVIVAAAAGVRAIERYKTTEIDVPFAKFPIALALTIVALVICALSLGVFSPAPVIFAAAAGLATLAILMGIRRLGLSLWAGDIIAAMAIGVVIAIALANAERHAGSGYAVLRYASHPESQLISVTQRIIADTGWLGTGAGTFELLLPIYGNASTETVGMPAPTTAAQIAIELGRPALWAILIMTLIVLFLLLRGALRRGRDSFYPAAGAGCIVVLTLEAFCDGSLFSSAVLLCTVAALGVGLAQRASRTSQ